MTSAACAVKPLTTVKAKASRSHAADVTPMTLCPPVAGTLLSIHLDTRLNARRVRTAGFVKTGMQHLVRNFITWNVILLGVRRIVHSASLDTRVWTDEERNVDLAITRMDTWSNVLPVYRVLTKTSLRPALVFHAKPDITAVLE